MDKELIAMCDTPEIQDRWEPKRGDFFQTWAQHDMRIIPFLINDDEPISKPLIAGTRKPEKEWIHIPRIEDVLEWLVPKRFSSWSNAHSEVERMYYSYNMAIKGWLAMSMHLEHNKTWNGEAWV